MFEKHTPVLLSEVIEYLNPRQGQTFVDCTLGAGGHAAAILEATAPNGRLIGIDLDPQAIAMAQENLKKYADADRVVFVKGNFADLRSILEPLKVEGLDGVLMDLGVSSIQLDQPERGFSFKYDSKLDMRMDASKPYTNTAEEVINNLSQAELEQIFIKFGEERWASKIASKILETRVKNRISSASQLARLIAETIPKRFQDLRIHPATRVFQSLRIYINDELANLKSGLKAAVEALNENGRICVISFHSLEDRIVKSTFRDLSKACICPPDFPVCKCFNKPKLQVLTKKPVIPQASELKANPRARSAKLRAAVKIGNRSSKLMVFQKLNR